MAVDSTTPVISSPVEGEGDSLFTFGGGAEGHAPPDEEGRSPSTLRNSPFGTASVELGIWLPSPVDSTLRHAARAVGLTPRSLLQQIVGRLCREIEGSEWDVPAFIQAASSATDASSEATAAFRRLTVRRGKRRCLRRAAEMLDCPPSTLVARRVDRIRHEIDLDIEGWADRSDPLDRYRRLLAVLYPSPTPWARS